MKSADRLLVSEEDVPPLAGQAAKQSPAIWVGHGEEEDIEGYLLPHVDTYTCVPGDQFLRV